MWIFSVSIQLAFLYPQLQLWIQPKQYFQSEDAKDHEYASLHAISFKDLASADPGIHRFWNQASLDTQR